MSHLRGTYESLSKFYLREARSCMESKAYRMVIVSAATSIHLAVYFILLARGKYNQEDRVAKFYDILQKIKQEGKWKQIEDDIEWLMNARNAVAHSEEWIIPETTTDSATGKTTMKPKVKINNLPPVKKKVFASSMTNELGSLSQLAKDAITKSESILSYLGFPVEQSSVNAIKEYLEKEISRMTGQSVDLENLPE
ncbi:MAG: hypothetical protein IIC67_06935 [Thaumarchaeota archaeon]|nr:hypothetical protein [Nitrososphaerota archaeon]